MDPKTQNFFSASEHFLEQGKFKECREYAIKAKEIDQNNFAATQILAIAEVLLVSDTINDHPHYYSVLKVPVFTQDQLLIKRNFMNATNLLNPNVNLYPFASEAFQVVLKAWSVLSNPTHKARFDNELRSLEKGGRFFEPARVNRSDGEVKSGGFSVPTQMNHFGDGFKNVSFLDPTQKSRFDDGVKTNEKNGSFFDPTRKTSFGDGGGGFFDPTRRNWFGGNGLKARGEGGIFLDPTQKSRFDGVLKASEKGGSFLDPTRKTLFGDGGGFFDPTRKTWFSERFKIREKGGTFYDPTQKSLFDGGGLKASEAGGSFFDPTRKTHFDGGLKTSGKDGNFLDPTRKTSSNDAGGGNTFWTMCPYCYYVYEHFKDYEDCCLRCQNEKCKRLFHALPIVGPPPPPEVAEKGEYYCFGFSVLGTEGKSLWSPFVKEAKKEKKNEKESDKDEYIEISDDDDDNQEKDGNGGKKESLGVKEEFVKTNGEKVDKGCTSFKKKRVKMMAKSSNKVLGKGNKVNLNEVVYNVEENEDVDQFGNKNDDIEFFVGEDDDIYMNLQDNFDLGAENIGALFS